MQTNGSGKSEALTRVIVDVKMILEGKEHKVQLRVFNTACSIDFQGIGAKSDAIFQHLKNMTVGKYSPMKSFLRL